ncbi:hypothetical protein SEA_NUBI_73 [Gordonia phage Nubi]|uniref:Uncharacterized protein n=1 Tax=Gordonia phage Nubi TaxID=2588492 RepID=A0A514CXG6_9CAUD|nr:hypothetical protein KNU68_gp73 [Gordonia phage Nubi]QDH85206.1 hypothetical protein SEA_NUBI_73 [Gordonia phage Nubi]
MIRNALVNGARPMDVPLTWSQETNYVRKINGRWWIAWAPFNDTTYAMAQIAGIVDQSWWVWFDFDTHADALEFAAGIHRSTP